MQRVYIYIVCVCVNVRVCVTDVLIFFFLFQLGLVKSLSNENKENKKTFFSRFVYWHASQPIFQEK